MKKILLLFLCCLSFVALAQTYCTSNLYANGCTSGDDLNSFSLGTFSQAATGCSPVFYEDYTSLSIQIIQSITPVPFSVTTNYSGGEYVGIWMDWNSDGDFDDANEFLHGSTASFGNAAPYTGTLLFDNSVPTGTFRMRVRVIWNTAPLAANSCTSFGYGETHDYNVTILPDIMGSCTPFTNFVIDSITDVAFKVNWTPAPASNSFYFEYGIKGFIPGSGTKITGTYPGASQPPIYISGLAQNTEYEYYFGEICNSGADSVYYGGPRPVKTLPSCPPLDSITILAIDSVSITFTYWGGTTDSIQYLFGPAGFNQASPSSSGSFYNDTVTISGLNPDTDYDLKLLSDCSKRGDGLSDTLGPVGFSTKCGYYHVPYLENFDAAVTPDMPMCWTSYIQPGSSFANVSTITYSLPFTPPNQLVLNNSDAPAANNILAIGPPVWGLNNLDKQVRFVGRSSNSSATMQIGTVSSPDNPMSFNAIQTINLSTTHKEYIVKLDAASSYNGTDSYIAIRHGNNANYQDVYIDKFEIMEIPSCTPTSVFNFYGSSNGPDVWLNWNPGGSSLWEIEYGTPGFNPGMGTTISSTDTFEVVTGLTANTRYDFYLRNDCGSGNYGPYIGPLNFLTGCGNPTISTTLPFFEDFETYSGTILGDTNFCSGNFSFEYRQENQGRLRFNAGTAYYSGGMAAATLDKPVFGGTADNYLIFTFDLTAYTSMAGIVLEFDFAHHDQGSFPGNKIWVRGSSSDPWVEIYDLYANQGNAGAFITVKGLNILPAIIAAGQSLSTTTQIRFGQSGTTGSDWSNTCCEGYTFDNIKLEAVSCPMPTGLTVTNLLDTAATLDWLNFSTATSFDVWFGPQGFYQGSSTPGGMGTMVNVTAPGLMVDTLNSNSCYEYVLRSYCANGDTSDWAGPFQFCTPCSPFSAPYFEGFEMANTGNVPDCWNYAIVGPSQFTNVEVINYSGPKTGSQHLRIYNSDNDSTMAISPMFDDMYAGDKRIKLAAKSGGSTGQIIVGTIPGGSDRSFTPLDTFILGVNYSIFYCDITAANGYNGTDDHVVIMHGNQQTYNNVYIDDFEYEAIPSCPEPYNGFADMIQPNSATLHWTGGGSATNVNIDFGPVGFTPSVSSVNYQSSTTNSITVGSLSSNTVYEWYVRDSCGTSDVSIWSGPFTFETLCALSGAPYFTGFENTPSNTMEDCWSDIQLPSEQFDYIYVNTTDPRNGSKSLYIYNTNNDTTVVVSPGFSDLTVGDKRVRFYGKVGFGSGNLIVGTVEHPEKMNTFIPLDTLQLTTNYEKLKSNISTANGYNGTHQYIAIMHGDANTYQTIFLDDFHYEIAPTCDESDYGQSFNINVNSASVTWQSVGGATNFNIAYGPVGFTPSPTAAGFATSTNDTTILTGLTAATAYEWYVQDSCGPGDVSIWEGPYSFRTLCNVFVAPYLEDFESSGKFCWTQEQVSGASEWSFATGSTGGLVTTAHSGNTNAQFTSTFNGGVTKLISPLIDVSNLASVELIYWYAQEIWFSDQNYTNVYYRDSPSDPWIFLKGDSVNSVMTWTPDTMVIPSTSTTLQIAFEGVDNYGRGNVIDDISINLIGGPSCKMPQNVTYYPTATGDIVVKWDTTGTGGQSFELEYGPSGYTPGTGTAFTSVSDSMVISGISGVNACVDVYLESKCGPNDSSYLMGPVSVCQPTTICTDSLEDYTSGLIAGKSSLFLPWQNAGGDAEFSTAQAASGTKSLHIYDGGPAGFSDVVAYFDTISSGIWDISFKYFVPTGKAGYYNIQQNHALNGVGNLWGAEVYLQANGTAVAKYGTGLVTVGSFTYAQNQWIDISTLIDLDNDSIWIEYNGTSTGVGWKYSAANGFPLQFNGINFYSGIVAGSGESAEFYMDDFCISPANLGCIPPSGLQDLNVGCDSIELDWISYSGSSLIEYGPTGFTQGQGTLTSVVTSPFTISGLTANTAYDFYVADTCTADTSNFAGSLTVTTASGPLPHASFTYSSVYTAADQTVTFDASGSSNGDTYSWDFGNGNTGAGITANEIYALPNATYQVVLTVTNACGTDDTTITINTNIGVEEMILGRSLMVYPNPTRGMVTISFVTTDSKEATVRLLDISGKEVMKVYKEEWNGKFEIVIDISHLADGIYMLQVSDGNFSSYRRLFKN